MEKHLSLSLVFIIIQRVIPGVIQLDQPINTTNGQILFAPAELEFGDLAFLSVVDGLFDLLDDSLWLDFLLLLNSREQVQFYGRVYDAFGNLVLEGLGEEVEETMGLGLCAY
jgi:hypothetical protein